MEIGGNYSLLMQFISSLQLTLLFFFALVCNLSFVLCKEQHFYYKFHENEIYIRMVPWKKHRGFAVLLPWHAVVTPRLCGRFPGQNRGVSGRTGTHRSASGATPGIHRRKTVALPGQTVINFWPKPGLVRSTAGNIWTHSNSFPVRPG